MTGASSSSSDRDPIDEVRMSFGDHLEALRRCVIRALLGALVAVVISLLLGKRLLAIVLQPLIVVLRSQGEPAHVMALSPPETFLVYLKLAFLCGLIAAMPWMIYQVWLFVAAGLYRREQRFAKMFVPLTALLFAAGVAFFYWIVLPIVLNFFITFSNRVEIPDLAPSWLQRLVLNQPKPAAASQPAGVPQTVPLLADDPHDAQPGAVWINTQRRDLRVMTDQGLWIAPLQPAKSGTAVTSQFSLQFYLSFVLSLALAFGLAFELPVVVVFLALTGILTTVQMARSRGYVIFGIVVAAAVLTPPDVVSQILLAIPMIVLFEGGLLVARTLERRGGAGAD